MSNDPSGHKSRSVPAPANGSASRSQTAQEQSSRYINRYLARRRLLNTILVSGATLLQNRRSLRIRLKTIPKHDGSAAVHAALRASLTSFAPMSPPWLRSTMESAYQHDDDAGGMFGRQEGGTSGSEEWDDESLANLVADEKVGD